MLIQQSKTFDYIFEVTFMGLDLLKLNRFCLYLLIYGACFEYWDPLGIASTISIAKLSTIPYFIISFFFLKEYLNLKFFKKYLFPLLIMILASFFSAVVNDIYVINVIEILDVRMLQLILLMFFISSNIVYDNKILPKVLNVFVFGIFTMSILYLAGAGIQYKGGRLFLFGENANITGMKTALAFIIIFYFLLFKNTNLKKIILFVIIGGPILTLLIASGSRGSLLSLFVGMFLFALISKIGFAKKIMTLVLGLSISILIFTYIQENDSEFMSRILSAVEKGENAGRGHLWNSAFNIIKDNLIFGVGNPGLLPAMRIYSGFYQEPHNLFLEMWLTTGVLGFIAFIVFLWRIIVGLFKNFRQTGDVLYLTMFIMVIMNVGKSGGGAGLIFGWLFFGIIISFIALNSQNKYQVESS